MQLANIPADESLRLNAVHSLGILDTEPDPRFDEITQKVIARFHVPISTISILDKDREWYKSCQGLAAKEGDRSISFCCHALFSEVFMVVEDTMLDPRFADNPAVVGAPFIRFYAGAVLREHTTRQPVGVLCMKDIKPRTLNSDELADFLELAKEAEAQLNNKNSDVSFTSVPQ